MYQSVIMSNALCQCCIMASRLIPKTNKDHWGILVVESGFALFESYGNSHQPERIFKNI